MANFRTHPPTVSLPDFMGHGQDFPIPGIFNTWAPTIPKAPIFTLPQTTALNSPALQPQFNQSTIVKGTSFNYRKPYITQVIVLPSIVLMVTFSILIIYVIIGHLRNIMKLYMSVIFYAVSILYFAAVMTFFLAYNEVKFMIYLDFLG